MSHYRLYFILDKRIRDFADLDCPSDEAAIERARELFGSSLDHYSAFEIWQRARLVHPPRTDRFPEPNPDLARIAAV